MKNDLLKKIENFEIVFTHVIHNQFQLTPCTFDSQNEKCTFYLF